MVRLVEIEHKGNYIRGLHHINNSSKIVIFLHGFTGNKNESGFQFSRQAKLFDKNNIDSIRFDYYGSGDSDGQFEDMNFNDLIKQGKKIIEYIKSLKYKEIYLEGMSMGGALAIKLASTDISKLILVSPAINMRDLANYIFDNNKILDNGNADVKSLQLSREFQKSIIEQDIFEKAINLDIPTLIIHGTKDFAVPYKNALIVKEKIKNSTLHSIEGADHVYSTVEYMEILLSSVLKFVKE